MDGIFEQRYIEARKKLIESDFAKLNPMQRKAVMATEGPLLILAGAGSGKTTVLINRIANLLRYGRASDTGELPQWAREEDILHMERGDADGRRAAVLEPVEPWRILAITFTNKAADELKSRLEKMLGAEANDIWALTFHSACVRILRRHTDILGYPHSFTIYDTNDSLSLIKRILKDLDLDDKRYPPRMMLSEISRAKDSGMSSQELYDRAKSAGDVRRVKIAEIYAEYSRRCFAAGAFDFDDLIFFTVKLLRENDDVRSYWQRRFRYVLIDEYQDTNALQNELAMLLSGGYENICVVGDDDQSIYKFRGATIENILTFEDNYKDCRVIRLEQNYRSTSNILDAANAVIRNNTGRKGKELWTNGDRGDRIELYVADNEHDEARYVAMQIMADYGRGGAWGDNAILYRMNAQSNQFEQVFKRNAIPYKIYGGMGFFDRAEVKDMLAYLCVVASPSDDLRLTRIINNPPRGIGASSVEKAAALAADRGVSLFDIVSHADSYPELGRATAKLRAFASMVSELKRASEELEPHELYDLLLEKTGYLRALEEKDNAENTDRAENVKELKNSILEYEKESENATLEGYLADVALYTELDNMDESGDCVVLMTLHSAKGLEFDSVYMAGVEEGIFPGIKAIGEQEEMEEERRLCYVGMTRAKRRLHITCAKQRMLFGKTTSNRISRFVDEIPEENINKPYVPKGYSYSEKSYIQNEFARRTEPMRSRPVAAPKSGERPAVKSVPGFAVGDRIRHKAFGEGVIVKSTPMGNDSLIEIELDSGAKKKLMLRAAATFMVKL
ncbi:MAG: UvrD-helicase domain-containing protein [Oscillospiraceae bacterium]|nr:UvrD-helicase domain-containing protein [Oscillospiraceae bacterium]